MSLEDDIINAVKQVVESKASMVVAFAGRVQAIDSNGFARVIVDGASGETPCVVIDGISVKAGSRAVVLRVRDTYYLVGQLGNRILHFPEYTGAHPTGTIPGDAWYRTDLNHAYMNVNGTTTQIV